MVRLPLRSLDAGSPYGSAMDEAESTGAGDA